MAQLPLLIPCEEIYDLDAFQLEDMQTTIKSCVTDDAQWNKKAKKILDLIELELKERQAIENFAFNIQIEDFIQQPIYQNNALQAILNDIKNRPANYLDVQISKPPLQKHEQPIQQKPDQQTNQQQHPPLNQQPQQSTQKISQQQSQSDAMSTSTMTRSSHPQSKVQPKKPNQLQDFMKDVLKKTDVSNQQFIIGAAINHRYIPPPPKPQLNTVEKIKQEKLMRKKKKKKVRTESQGKAVEHLPAIGKSASVVKTQSKMEQSNVHSQSSATKQNFELKQKSLDFNINNQENKEELSEKCIINSQTQSNNLVVITNQLDQNDPKEKIKDNESTKIIMEQNVKSNIDQYEECHVRNNETNFQQQLKASNNQVESYRLTNENNNSQIKSQQNFELKQQDLGDQQRNIIQKGLGEHQFSSQQRQTQDSNQFQINTNNVDQDYQNEFLQKNQQNSNEELEMNQIVEQKQNKMQSEELEQLKMRNQLLQNHYNKVINEYINNDELIGNSNSKDDYLKQIQLLQNKQIEQEEYEDNMNDEVENENENEEFTQQQSKLQQPNKQKKNDNENMIQLKSHQEQRNTTKNQIIVKQSVSQQSQRKQDLKNRPSVGQKGNVQKQLTMESRKSDDFHEVESDHDQINVAKQKPNKEFGIKQLGKVDQSKQKAVVDSKQKVILTDKEKMDEINNICKEMGLDEFKAKQQQSASNPTQIIKAITPSANNRPKNPQSKYIQKMLQCIDDSKLEDYSDIVPTFQHLFSGFFNNQPHYNHLDVMREIFSIFSQHIDKVDNVDSLLGKYKSNPLAINPNELVYINDPHRLIQYSTRTGVDIQQYIQRQMVFNKRLQNDSTNLGKQERYFRVVKTKEEVYDIITRSFMRKQGWTELPHGIGLRTSWNVLWTWSKPQIDLNKLLFFQKVNHFPFNKNLGRKDLLKKNIERCQKLGTKAQQIFDIIPSTFLLPKEYVQFMEKFYKDSESEGQQNIWIMKPTGKSRGRGITVLNDISDVMYAEPVVLQKYLKNPLLLKGHKFDMRIYVLVTSFNPLEVFLYKEGFARLTTQPFTLDINDLKNQLVHLTNFAVQKTHVQIQDLESQLGGCKISLRQLREKLIDRNIDWNKIWEQVQDIVLKSLVACQSEIPNNPNSFELFGYDIIIDTNQKCWLLEVNASPSLARDYILDELIKQQLIDDIFDLIDSPNYDRQRLCEVLERRIQEEQGCKSVINTMNNSKLQLQRDLNYILNGTHLRRYGEMPKQMGGFMRLAPSEKYDKLKSLVQSYKTINGRGTID
ncbi:unnamed protein product [Paramecium octaurelia]|uniref:Tubulin-tyrosine ligase family protein n=1 Tax=Paramecium octaurelia TaxID=43137 RepID=A0A8S1Y2J6_PAROT|nr:unnamed protein product [Paramecium octaurelia]